MSVMRTALWIGFTMFGSGIAILANPNLKVWTNPLDPTWHLGLGVFFLLWGSAILARNLTVKDAVKK